jgi:hypothetical protein
MIRRSLVVVVALAGLVAAAHAERPAVPAAPPAPALQGTFGFDVFKPKRACAKVTGALLTRLRSYRCGPAETDTASGKPTVATCKARRDRSEYMLFATAADCNEERETQLANGAGD